jgi:hypothetical protein
VCEPLHPKRQTERQKERGIDNEREEEITGLELGFRQIAYKLQGKSAAISRRKHGVDTNEGNM